jgi:lipid A 3-O-deacylase
VKSTPTRGVKQYLKPNAYNQSELDWTLMTISAMTAPEFGEMIMADGTFAVLTLVLGLVDMGVNYCGTEAGCFGRSETTSRMTVSAGEVLERVAKTATEIYLRYDLGQKLGPFGNAIGLSVGEGGETWIGLGATYTLSSQFLPFYAELHFMPGFYLDNGGYDLGGLIEFRSGIELGYESSDGWRYGASYDHRSNGSIYDNNPGIETVQWRVAVPVD